MTRAPGSPGTASDGFRVVEREGRHRSPPPPKPDPRPAVIGGTAALLVGASLIAIGGQAVAPDASAAACTNPTQGESCPTPADDARESGLDLPRRTARAANATSPPSGTLTSTVQGRVGADAETPSPSRSATANRPSRLSSVASEQPGQVPGSTSVLTTTLTRQSPSPENATVTTPPENVTTTTTQPATTTVAPPTTAATTTSSATTEETTAPVTTDSTPTDVSDVEEP